MQLQTLRKVKIAPEQTIFLHCPGEPWNSSFSNALLHQRRHLIGALVHYIHTFPQFWQFCGLWGPSCKKQARMAAVNLKQPTRQHVINWYQKPRTEDILRCGISRQHYLIWTYLWTSVEKTWIKVIVLHRWIRPMITGHGLSYFFPCKLSTLLLLCDFIQQLFLVYTLYITKHHDLKKAVGANWP